MNHSAVEREHRPREGALALVGWILLLVGLGAGSGLLFGPDAWFAGLQKPSWNPPSWLFGPVWTTLYAMMALALWLVRREPEAQDGRRKRAQWLFALQFALNMAWTPMFFGLHSPSLALVTIGLLWVTLLATLLAFFKVRVVAGALLVPYGLWVSFATALNGAIWHLNS
jgi:translocator protein